MRGRLLGYAAAILAHLAIIFLGGLLFLRPPEASRKATVEDVDLLSEAADEQKKPEDEKKPASDSAAREAADQPLQDVREAPPDMRELFELQAAASAPALEALSLNALEGALNPDLAADGDFAGAYSLSSGGRIGGTGAAGVAGGGEEGPMESVFGLAELDQKPRPIFQSAPNYPYDMRQKKIEGVVYVLFVVDQDGRVVNPRIEKSTHTAFDKPALDAVKQWRFEPAVRDGRKVMCKLRVPIRFAAT